MSRTDIESRAVSPARGWRWLVEGVQLFLRKPIGWTILIVTLFAITKATAILPILGLVVFLLMPVFVAGLMDGCKATEDGRPLHLSSLFSGFQRNVGPLITIGGISLIGNLGVMAFVAMLAGDSFVTLAKAIASNQNITPQMAAQLQPATAIITKALLAGLVLSIPLLMALWFAPPLIHFNDCKPALALKTSFVACLRNMMPMLIYGAAILAVFVMLMPLAMASRLYDLGFWLMAPVLVPSIYASYKDLFGPADATSPGENSLLK